LAFHVHDEAVQAILALAPFLLGVALRLGDDDAGKGVAGTDVVGEMDRDAAVRRLENGLLKAGFALRVIEASVSTPPSDDATFRLVLVSTAPGSCGVIAMTPVGSAARRSSARAVVCSSAASPSAADSIERTSPSSDPA